MNTQTTTSEFTITLGGNPFGTFLQGYLIAKYRDLKKILGDPHEGDGYKIDAEWDLNINGKQMTVYNYKDGKNYNGVSGTAKTKITEWHIGAAIDITQEGYFLASKVNGVFQKTY